MLKWSAILLLAALASGVAHADDAASGPDQDLMLMAVSLDSRPLADAMPCYLEPDVTLVPLGQLAEVLKLAIKADADGAQGWAYSEDRKFRIDRGSHTASFGDVQVAFTDRQVTPRDDDLYVDIKLLSKVLPIDFEVDLRSALIRVHPRETLPLQQAWLREQQLSVALAGHDFDRLHFQELDVPYHAFSLPALDQTFNLSVTRSQSGIVNRELRYLTHATGEFLFMHADVLLSGAILTPVASTTATAITTNYGPFKNIDLKTRSMLPDIRVHLGRQDPEGRLLGGLHATDFGVGDVGFPGLALVANPVSGPGFLVTNRPLELPDEFDRHTFQGQLPQGWDIELYRNGGLIGFQTSRPDGRYEFASIPVGFGVNTFKLVFHGPQGQIREEQQVFDVSRQIVPPGKLYYRFTGNVPTYLGRRSLAELDYGITKGLSLGAAFATVQKDGKDQMFLKSSVRGFWHFMSGTAEYATELGGGSVAMASVEAQLGTLHFSAERDQLFNYQSEYFTSVGPLKARSSVRADGTIPLGFARLPLQLEFRRDELTDGQVDSRILATSTGQYRNLGFTETLNWPLDKLGLPATGDNAISLGIGPVSIRGGVSYHIRPKLEISNLSFGVDSRNLQNYLWSVGVSKTPFETRYQASVGKTQGRFGTTLTASWSPQSGTSFLLSFSVGLEHVEDRGWELQARDTTSSGLAAADVFLDQNGNGKHDPGEKPLDNVQLVVDGQAPLAQTDENGVAVLHNLPTTNPVNVAIVERSLSDPYMHPLHKGLRLVPRAGRTMKLEFPVQMTGEVDGTLFADAAKKHPLAGVELQLVSSTGEVVKSRTAFDGYYDVPNLVPGRYVLSVTPKQKALAGLTAPTKTLTIGPDGTVLDGQDLVCNEGKAGSTALAKNGSASDEIQLPAKPGDPFELPTKDGTILVKAIKTIDFPLVSWAAGLPLEQQDMGHLDLIGMMGIPKNARILIVVYAQTMGPAAGAVKRATKGARQLKRYLQAVEMLPGKKIFTQIVPPAPTNGALGHVSVMLLHPASTN